jgi:hypothetical protein
MLTSSSSNVASSLIAALRARRRRGLHEDDLALRGYEGEASSDRTLQAEAVNMFLTDTLVGG